MSYVPTNSGGNMFEGFNLNAEYDAATYEATDANFDTCTANTPDSEAGSAHTISTDFLGVDGGRINLTDLVKDVMEQAAKCAAAQMTAALQALPHATSGLDVSGLRSQIKANALVLLPMMKPGEEATFYTRERKAVIPDVIVEYLDPIPGSDGLIIQASVVYLSKMQSQQKLVKGAAANTVVAALQDLLDVTMQLLNHMPKVNKAFTLVDRSHTVQEFKLPGGGSYLFENQPYYPFGPGDMIWWGPASSGMLGVPLPPKVNVLDHLALRVCYNDGADPVQGKRGPIPVTVNSVPVARQIYDDGDDMMRSPTPRGLKRGGNKPFVHGNPPNSPVDYTSIDSDELIFGIRGAHTATVNPKGPATRAPAAKAKNQANGSFGRVPQPTMEDEVFAMDREFNTHRPIMPQAGLINGLNGALPQRRAQ